MDKNTQKMLFRKKNRHFTKKCHENFQTRKLSPSRLSPSRLSPSKTDIPSTNLAKASVGNCEDPKVCSLKAYSVEHFYFAMVLNTIER